MDAPPDKEDTRPFIVAANALHAQRVHTPEIHHQQSEQGFLLLEDLGNRLFQPELQNAADTLYTQAINALIKIQCGVHDQAQLRLVKYNDQLLNDEMQLFIDWYLGKHLTVALAPDAEEVWNETKQFLIRTCQSQPQVWVHRDYHSRNLMITEQNSPGVIDFQDMVIGPIAYDLASLFKDCYFEWPRSKQHAWLAEYYQSLTPELLSQPFSLDELIRWVDLTGLQRHLKVLGIFCRLNYRDGKDQYLGDLPLVANYVLQVLELYPELEPFENFFAQPIRQAALKKSHCK